MMFNLHWSSSIQVAYAKRKTVQVILFAVLFGESKEIQITVK